MNIPDSDDKIAQDQLNLMKILNQCITVTNITSQFAFSRLSGIQFSQSQGVTISCNVHELDPLTYLRTTGKQTHNIGNNANFGLTKIFSDKMLPPSEDRNQDL